MTSLIKLTVAVHCGLTQVLQEWDDAALERSLGHMPPAIQAACGDAVGEVRNMPRSCCQDGFTAAVRCSASTVSIISTTCDRISCGWSQIRARGRMLFAALTRAAPHCAKSLLAGMDSGIQKQLSQPLPLEAPGTCTAWFHT